MKKIYVAGYGIISCLGGGIHQTLSALTASRSGLTSLFFNQEKSITAGVVSLGNDELAHHVGADAKLPRAALLGIYAAKEAYLQCGIQHMENWRVGLISGCLFGGTDKTEQFYPKFREDTSKGRLRDVVHHSPGRVSNLIAGALQINDYVTTVNTGASSALHALITGLRMIKHDFLDVVFVGGTEAISHSFVHTLQMQQLIDPLAARPFDASCAGLNPGEGAAYLVLVSEKVVARENSGARALFAGYGSSNVICNTFSSTLKEESAFSSMNEALRHNPNHAMVQYLNLFGSGVPEFDVIEAAAVTNLFGSSLPACSSTKGFTGYTGGACGAIESVIALLSASQQCVFRSPGFSKPIPEIGIQPEKELKNIPVENVMVNAFGFKGNCASVLFSKAI